MEKTLSQNFEPRAVQQVNIVQVIHVRALKGQGCPESPVRMIDQYWSMNGTLLAEVDIVKDALIDIKLSKMAKSAANP